MTAHATPARVQGGRGEAMSKHTRGPWRLDDAQRNVLALKTKGICEVPGRGIISTGVDKANARLIVSAPDMLAALEAVMYFWGRDPLAFGDEATINSLAGRFAVIADQCRVARNAARGLEDS